MAIVSTQHERLITVCSACLTASCWHYEFICDEYRMAGIVKKGEYELNRLHLEHPDNYSKAKIDLICGSTEYVLI